MTLRKQKFPNDLHEGYGNTGKPENYLPYLQKQFRLHLDLVRLRDSYSEVSCFILRCNNFQVLKLLKSPKAMK